MKIKNNGRGSMGPKRGSAMVMMGFMAASIATLSLALVATSGAHWKENRQMKESQAAEYIASAGLSQALVEMRNGGDGNLGSAGQASVFGASTFWVEAVDQGDGVTSLVATGLENRSGARMELLVREVINTERVWAAFGDEGVTMDSNAFIDSYDSGAGSYDSQDTNGSGNDTWAGENGHVGSNGSISLSQNSGVHGDAAPGPTGTTTILGNAEVSGSTVPSPVTMPMPPLEIPVGTMDTDYTVSGNETLAAGTYFFDDFTIDSNSTLDVIGPIVIVTNTMTLESNAEFLLNSANGDAQIYVINDFVLNSNTFIGSTDLDPLAITLQLDSDNVIDPDLDVDLDEVDFDSNAQMYGTIYAPNAFVEINSNFELFGAIVARRLHLDSNSMIHFDERLTEVDQNADPVFETIGWRSLPYSPRDHGYTPGGDN